MYIVYLLTINFACVLIVYFQNIVYSCITINFTISYVQIAHIYYTQCTCNYSAVYTFVTLYEFSCTCAVYSTVLNASIDTVSYAASDQNYFKGGERGQNLAIKTLLIPDIICNLISIHTIADFVGSSKRKDIFRILNNVKTNFQKLLLNLKSFAIFEQLQKSF